MGFLDSLLGKTVLPKARSEKLFAISTAAISLESLGIVPGGKAAICFKAMDSSRLQAARTEIEELLSLSGRETGTKHAVESDRYGFLWVVLEDRDFEDLVTGIHMVSQTLADHGFGEWLLCAVYLFKEPRPVYWIYNFKQGSYYPFVPSGESQRDNALEFRLRSLMEKELPIQKDLERWYPLWGMPI